MKTNQTPSKILLIEDDDDHAELVKIAMESNNGGNQLNRVRNGVEGLAYLNQESPYEDAERPDIILLDLNMPMVNGQEVIQRVKANDDLRSIPIIVLTTSNAEQDRVRAYESNANSYLVKPIDFSSFREMIADLERYWTVWNQSPSQHTTT